MDQVQFQVRIGSCCIFGQPEVYCSVAPFLPSLTLSRFVCIVCLFFCVFFSLPSAVQEFYLLANFSQTCALAAAGKDMSEYQV